MNKKDASVLKILAELGLGKEETLSDDQEYAMKYATDDHFRFEEDIKRIYSQPHTDEKK